jgi:hypothetical protein
MAPSGDQPTEPTLLCELSVLTVPSCIWPSKRPPRRRNCTGTVKCPVCPHSRHTERRWSHSHLSPTDNLYPVGRYGSTLAELNSALTPLLARWCVWKVPWSGWPTWFQTGVSSCPPNISKTPTPMLQKQYNRECTEECTLIPDPRSVVLSSPPPKYPKCFLLPVLPHSRQEPLLPS